MKMQSFWLVGLVVALGGAMGCETTDDFGNNFPSLDLGADSGIAGYDFGNGSDGSTVEDRGVVGTDLVTVKDDGDVLDQGHSPDNSIIDDDGSVSDSGQQFDNAVAVDEGGVNDPGSKPDTNIEDPGINKDQGTEPDNFISDPGQPYDPGVVDKGGVPDLGPIDTGYDPGVATDPGTVQDVCEPDCDGRECGADGCGGACGTCSYNESCEDGQCVPESTECYDDPVGSCKAYYVCVGDCSTYACKDACGSAFSDDGFDNYASLDDCLYFAGCFDFAGDAFYTCLDDNCLDEYFGCFWGCDYETCYDLTGCIVDCDGVSACAGECWENSTTSAQLDLQAALDCMSDACPVCDIENPTSAEEAQCKTCWSNAYDGVCASAWDKCSGTPVYGDENCGYLWDCANECADSACVQACGAEVDQQAIGLYNDIFECLEIYCPDSMDEDDWLECANTEIAYGGYCRNQYIFCQDDI